MKREDEEICKDAFNKYLSLRFDTKVISWEEVSQENEPPDYFLKLNGEKFAVEVTQIMITKELDKKKISILSVVGFIEGLIQEVKQNTVHIPNGSYFLSYQNLLNNHKYASNSRNNLVKNIIKYIEDTQNVNNAPKKTILQKGYNELFAITKVNNLKKEIIGSSIDFFNADGVMKEVYSLIKSSMIEKAHKLSKINKPKILLLYDNYRLRSEVFAQESDIENLINFLDNNLMGFHTIFWVYNDKDGFVLYSEKFN